MQPFIVSHVIDSIGNVVYETTPTIVRRAISPATSDFVRRELELVVTADRGTARASAVPGHTVGGKTGTGQQGVRADGINSLTYIAYTPVENPEFIVLMVAHNVQNTTIDFSAGGHITPHVRRFFEDVIAFRGMQPSDDVNFEQFQPVLDDDMILTPNWVGESLFYAVRSLSNADIDFHVIGSGLIIESQIPAPGRPMPRNSPVHFIMDPNSRQEWNMVIVPDIEGLSISQAEIILRDAGLGRMLRSVGQPPVGWESDRMPSTSMPATSLDPNTTPQLPPSPAGVVFRQFPAAGTEVQRGLDIRVRVTQ